MTLAGICAPGAAISIASSRQLTRPNRQPDNALALNRRRYTQPLIEFNVRRHKEEAP
jgi:hypothetical protein